MTAPGSISLLNLLERVTPLGVDGGSLDLPIAEVRDDSRAVQPGDLFVAVRGQTVDGHRCLQSARERGAVAAIVDQEGATFDGVRVVVASTRRALGQVAANRYGRPGDHLGLIGITGTNGKTTTSYLAEALIKAAGGMPGVIGTVEYRYAGRVEPAPFTTPDPLSLHSALARMARAGCTHVAMECSSHALALDRLESLFFRVAAFTNLTQDHLDFHGTMTAYCEAKARLFSEHLKPESGTAVVLTHGVEGERPAGRYMVEEARGRVLRVGVGDWGRLTGRGRLDVSVKKVSFDVRGIDAEIATPVGVVHLRSPLIGAFNLENLVVAVGIGVALELDAEKIGAALSAVAGVPGRMERVPSGESGIGVFVDYAHTPDALERVLEAARPVVTGRLFVVFGCGGDRDRTKRPKMGAAATRYADIAIVTSDNPRTEEPRSIVEMIVEGIDPKASPLLPVELLSEADHGHFVEVDRRRAIDLALSAAEPGDVVIIAGKGHEDYQIVGTTKHYFDDREEAARVLARTNA